MTEWEQSSGYSTKAAQAWGLAQRQAKTITEARVLHFLHRLETKYRRATPGRELLATVAGCSTRTVTRATRRLEDAGWLFVVRDRPHYRDGRWTRSRTNLYRVRMARNPRSRRGDTDDTSIAASRCYSSAGGRRARRPARPPPTPLALFAPEPPDETPTPPPWVTAGITFTEWAQRARSEP